MSRWSVYILRCRDGSLYTGISTDIEARLKTHNAGKGAAYTRSRKPVTLVWSEAAKTESKARKREAEIKGWSKSEKEEFIRTLKT
jgi:putative endonuclease